MPGDELSEPKNVVNTARYTSDLPILKDSHPEAGEHLGLCKGHLANANNSRGENSREKIGFIRNSLEKNGTRRARCLLRTPPQPAPW